MDRTDHAPAPGFKTNQNILRLIALERAETVVRGADVMTEFLTEISSEMADAAIADEPVDACNVAGWAEKLEFLRSAFAREIYTLARAMKEAGLAIGGGNRL